MARGGGMSSAWTRAWRGFTRAAGLDAAASYSPRVWLLAVGTVVSYLGRGAAIPFVVLYLTQAKDIPLYWVGPAIVAEQVTRALLSPLFGSLSDRWGRKPFMVAGVVLQGITFPTYLLVEGIPSYLAVSVLAGLGQAPYQPALSAYLADVTPTTQRVGVFGLVHMMKNVGWGFGVVMGGILVSRSFALLFLIGGALPLLYAVLIGVFVPESSSRAARAAAHGARRAGLWRAVLADRRFLTFLALATIIFLTWGQLNTVLPVFITQGLLLDELWVTRAFALNAVLIIILQIPVSARVESWSRTRGLAVAAVTTGVGYVVLASTPRLWHVDPAWAHGGLFAGVVLLTLAEMVETPLTFTMASEMAPAGSRGGAMGVLALAAPLGMGLAPFLAGIISERAPWPWVWYAFTALALVEAVGFVAFGRHLARSPIPNEADDAQPTRASV